MGIIIRQSILTSVISYVGVIIGYINLVYLYPKFLEPEQVGLLRTIQDAALLFTPFAVFGLGQSIIRFYPHFARDQEHANRFITLIFALGIATYGVFLAVFFSFRDYFVSFFTKNAAEIVDYAPLILLLTLILLFITLLEQYSRSLLRVAFPAFLKEVATRVLQGVLVSFYFLRYITFHQFILLSVGIYLAVLLILLYHLVAAGNFRIRVAFGEFDRSKLREILVFSALSFVGTSAMILIGKMDSVMVTGMIGLASNAVYTTAFYMATVIEIPKRAITTTASTLIAKAFERDDIAEVRAIYTKTSINQFIVGSLLLIGIWANLPNLYDIMPKGEVYRAGAYVVLIMGCGKLIDMLFGPSSEIIGLSKHYWFNMVVITMLAVIVVVSNYLLIPRYGIDGAAYGSVLALFLYNAVKFVFIYLKFGLQPFTFNTVKVIFVSAAAVVLNILLPSLSNVFIDIAVRSFLIAVVFVALVVLFRCSDEVNTVLGKLAARFLRKG